MLTSEPNYQGGFGCWFCKTEEASCLVHHDGEDRDCCPSCLDDLGCRTCLLPHDECDCVEEQEYDESYDGDHESALASVYGEDVGWEAAE